MVALNIPDDLHFEVIESVIIAAPIEVSFTSLIDEMTHANEAEAGNPMPMRLECFPGGRWYRDLGNDQGHCWGFVQAIKKPTLLEISGPLFMSCAVCNNLQYRLKAVDAGTELRLRHSAFGLIDPGHRSGVAEGWHALLERVVRRAV